jgi:hypothetical protein
MDHDEQLLLPHQIKAEPDDEQELENNNHMTVESSCIQVVSIIDNKEFLEWTFCLQY